ncbi:MAG: glutamate-1-semialdehyde 2,1-aminomutase [Candidatus Anammoxibacter sp.]
MKNKTNYDELARKARQLIPGGAHTYSKGGDQFPSSAPKLIARGEGCYCYDVDGRKYIDWGVGLGSVILGHCYPRIIDAVTEQLKLGSNFLRPTPIELELAELLIDIIPSAEMCKFAKNGSNVTTAAVKLARAYTQRDYVALCSDHPFFSFDDWFIGTTPCNAGIPKAVRELSLTFRYNDIDNVKELFQKYPKKIAAVILEPATGVPPENKFLEKLKEITHENGSVLIFDEMITGFRMHLSGAQKYFNVIPDISTFGKAMGNGFSVATVVGKREIMELGGIDHNKEKVFLLSTTHGAETHSLAAAIANIKEFKEKDVISHLWSIGKLLQDGIRALIKEKGLENYFAVGGYSCRPGMDYKESPEGNRMELYTLFLQEMFKQGILMLTFMLTYSHTEKEVNETLKAIDKTFDVCKDAIKKGSIKDFIEGPTIKPVFRKYN